MKKNIPFLLLFICFLFFIKSTKAQTVLTAGDIAFTGYISAGATDEFSFVLLKDISPTTTITFTENAWLHTGSLRTGEETLIWTAGVTLLTGTEIKISGVGSSTTITCSLGSATGNMLNFSTSGDQVLAYQGLVASPTFISAIHMNVYSTTIGDAINTDAATWDNTNSNSTNASALPPGLTTGSTAIWVGTFQTPASEFDNAVFNCTGVPSNVTQIRTAVNNPANWTKSNGSPTTPVAVPSGCSFFTVTAVNLVSFSAKLNSNNTTSLQWKIEDHQKVDKFTIEKSNDGISFKSLSTLNSSLSTNGTYYYTDYESLIQNAYYRIKITELSGKVFYSNIVSIGVKTKVEVTIYPNPVVNELVIRQDVLLFSKTAQLLSATGVVLQQINITSKQHSVNVKSLAAGLYYLKMDEGKVIKIIKQ